MNKLANYLIKKASQGMNKQAAFTALGTPIGAAIGGMLNNAPGRVGQGIAHGAGVGLLGGMGTDAMGILGTALGGKLSGSADGAGVGAALGALLGAGISYPLAHKLLRSAADEAEQRENDNKIALISKMQQQGVNPSANLAL